MWNSCWICWIQTATQWQQKHNDFHFNLFLTQWFECDPVVGMIYRFFHWPFILCERVEFFSNRNLSYRFEVFFIITEPVIMARDNEKTHIFYDINSIFIKYNCVILINHVKTRTQARDHFMLTLLSDSFRRNSNNWYFDKLYIKHAKFISSFWTNCGGFCMYNSLEILLPKNVKAYWYQTL